MWRVRFAHESLEKYIPTTPGPYSTTVAEVMMASLRTIYVPASYFCCHNSRSDDCPVVRSLRRMCIVSSFAIRVGVGLWLEFLVCLLPRAVCGRSIGNMFIVHRPVIDHRSRSPVVRCGSAIQSACHAWTLRKCWLDNEGYGGVPLIRCLLAVLLFSRSNHFCLASGMNVTIGCWLEMCLSLQRMR